MNVLKKIKIRVFVLSLIIILLIDFLMIACIAFVSEKEAPQFFQEGTFLDIIKNDNSNIDLNDYCLLNWAGSKDGKTAASELPYQVIYGNFKRVSRFEAVIVQLLQNRFNSIVQVFSIELYSETKGKAAGQASFVKIGNSYYVIAGYTLKIKEKLEYTTAVYKAKSDISVIEKYETDKPRFADYHFYPLYLSSLLSSPFDKILNVLFVIFETNILYVFLVKKFKSTDQSRDQSGDGSMIES